MWLGILGFGAYWVYISIYLDICVPICNYLDMFGYMCGVYRFGWIYVDIYMCVYLDIFGFILDICVVCIDLVGYMLDMYWIFICLCENFMFCYSY